METISGEDAEPTTAPRVSTTSPDPEQSPDPATSEDPSALAHPTEVQLPDPLDGDARVIAYLGAVAAFRPRVRLPGVPDAHR